MIVRFGNYTACCTRCD